MPSRAQNAFDPARAAAELHQSLYERAEAKPARILVLGTFHFGGSSADSRSSGDAGMLSPARQAEIGEVLDLLQRFGPTKIALEYPAPAQDKLDSAYRDFKAGNRPEEPNELWQLGFVLANRLGMESVHAVDAEGRWLEPRTDPAAYARDHGQADRLRDEFTGPLSVASAPVRKVIQEQKLRDVLLFLNAPERLRDSHAEYLQRKLAVGTPEEYPGVDGFVSQWYNRNLRIYANVLRMAPKPEERILLVIGSGHAPILRHLFESSLHFELVDVADILGNDPAGAPK